jgi:anaerobic magnesium-protoporphyrin IX monomethyl ester cyclase
VRVCLVIPSSGFLLDQRVFMSLGILNVAAMLERDNIPVEVLDLSGVADYEKVVACHATENRADVYGLTATSPQMPDATIIARTIRRSNPSARTIIGGPHPTLVLAARKLEQKRGRSGRAVRALEQLLAEFDVIVAGDGEFAVLEALKPTAPRIVDGDDPKSSLFLTNQSLDELPWPARHLLDVSSYHYSIDGERALSLIGQRACPFKCTFCSGRNSPFLRRVRTRSTENIVGEVLHLHHAYGVRGLMWYEDELTVNPQLLPLMNRLADEQEKLGVSFRMRGFVKAEMLRDDQAAAMYRAGFRWILVGFESGHPRILQNIEKVATVEDNDRCMDIATRHGLKVKALMSIGHAGESAETIEATRQWVLNSGAADFDCTVITPYPGSPYYDDALETSPGVWTYAHPKTGDRLHQREIDFSQVSNFYKGIPGQYTAYTFTDHLRTNELVNLRDGFESSVRSALAIPYPETQATVQFEHSMGMTGVSPTKPSLLKNTHGENGIGQTAGVDRSGEQILPGTLIGLGKR